MKTREYSYDSENNQVHIKEEEKSFIDWFKLGYQQAKDDVANGKQRKKLLNALADALLAEATVEGVEPAPKKKTVLEAVVEAATSK